MGNVVDFVLNARARRPKFTTIKLQHIMEDGQPIAVRVRPFRTADYFENGIEVPVLPATPVAEWGFEKQRELYVLLCKVVPCGVIEQRAIQVAHETGEPIYTESWTPLRVVPNGTTPKYENNEIDIDDLASLGLESLGRIGAAILWEAQVGGDLEELPGYKEGGFRPGQIRPARLDGETVEPIAARDTVQSA